MDGQDAKNLHRELTRQIIGYALEVINDLGSGFLESVYEKAMMVALSDKGLSVESRKPIAVRFRGKPVGNFFADLLVEKKVIVELKAVRALTPEHQAQTINYLNATGINVGLRINFGNPRLEFRRFTRTCPVHPVNPCGSPHAG
jgi:GxxExxY protein